VRAVNKRKEKSLPGLTCCLLTSSNLLGDEQCGQCTRGKRNLYLGWPGGPADCCVPDGIGNILKKNQIFAIRKIKQKRHHDFIYGAAEHSLVYVFLVSPPKKKP
jgi:hypothetical protein